MTPVFFGSAVNNFGVRELLHGMGVIAPAAARQPAQERSIAPSRRGQGLRLGVSNPGEHGSEAPRPHRVRAHLLRPFQEGHEAQTCPLRQNHADAQPADVHGAGPRGAEEAFAGDIIGIPNHGNLRIGDALTEGEDLHFTGIPSFAPELMQRARADDPMKAKHLSHALEQLAEEGAARIFKPLVDSNWIVGVVGALQFDVLADRIRTEYDVPVKFEEVALHTARWLSAEDAAVLKIVCRSEPLERLAMTMTAILVFLARNAWHLNDAQDKNPKIIMFRATK